MGLSADDIARLDARAREVGRRLHWEMHFQTDDDPAFAGVTAGARHVFIMGPARLSDLTRESVEAILDALAAGTRRIVDGDGVPHLI
ncbi:conserved hypothetical protein [uncultured Mycobacterium sp.]|uniref:Uncharacterized protein n=1 Tax=uncultured Mycobacterium sp. TaxID=171292 RepID=A0A1Y5PFG9_9MYCO|nr:conserved hypothetical protein [uncultured Mycobacterium sp.]